MIDAMMPDVSREFLTRMMEGYEIKGVEVGVNDGNFSYSFG